MVCVCAPLVIAAVSVCLLACFGGCRGVCCRGALPGQYFYFQEVLPVLAAKHCMMQATAELHQSKLAGQKKRFGEEIARLQVSLCLCLCVCVSVSVCM